MREWAAHLTSTELAVLLFIYDQTVGLGEAFVSRPVTYSMIESGNDHTAGIGLKRRQAIDTVASLVAKGFITVDSDKTRGLIVSINYEWEAPVLPVPKRLQVRPDTENQSEGGAENCTPPVRKTAPPLCGNPHPIKENKKEYHLKEASRPADAGRDGDSSEEFSEQTPTVSAFPPGIRIRQRPAPSVPPSINVQPDAKVPSALRAEDVIRSVQNRSAERAAEAKAGRKISDYETTWRAAWADEYKDQPGSLCPSWSEKQRHMFRGAVMNQFKGRERELHDFLTWVVRDWRFTMAGTFKWMKTNKPPDTPCPSFLAGQFRVFLDAYQSREKNRYVSKLSGGLQDRYTAMKLRGMEHDAIMEELGRLKALSQMAEKNAEIRAHQAAREKRIQEREEALRSARPSLTFQQMKELLEENRRLLSEKYDRPDDFGPMEPIEIIAPEYKED